MGQQVNRSSKVKTLAKATGQYKYKNIYNKFISLFKIKLMMFFFNLVMG